MSTTTTLAVAADTDYDYEDDIELDDDLEEDFNPYYYNDDASHDVFGNVYNELHRVLNEAVKQLIPASAVNTNNNSFVNGVATDIWFWFLYRSNLVFCRCCLENSEERQGMTVIATLTRKDGKVQQLHMFAPKQTFPERWL